MWQDEGFCFTLLRFIFPFLESWFIPLSARVVIERPVEATTTPAVFFLSTRGIAGTGITAFSQSGVAPPPPPAQGASDLLFWIDPCFSHRGFGELRVHSVVALHRHAEDWFGLVQ